jgi:hypothetical protein
MSFHWGLLVIMVIMSKAFHRARIFIPPVADWRQWICTIDPSRARELGQIVVLLNRRIKKLPRDVWNIIIGRIYHGTVHGSEPGPTDGSLVNWMEYWITHPEQQRAVPLLISPGSEDLQEFNNLSGLNALCGLDHVTKQPIPNYVPPDCVVVYEKARWEHTGERHRSLLFRIGEFVLGVIVDDPKMLPYLTIHVPHIDTLPFSPEFTAQMQSPDGKWVMFYYNPEIPVLPVIAMQYQQAQLEWHHPDIPPPPTTIVWVMCQNDLRRVAAQSSHVLTFSNYMVKEGFLQIKRGP